jgi:hypothetical protein
MNAPYASRDPQSAVAPASWHSFSTWLLITANLVPLAGVLWFGWEMSELFLLYWLESAIVGGYNVLKLLLIGGAKAVPLCVFFTIHYGGFMAGHLLFLSFFFLGSPDDFSFSRLPSLLVGIVVRLWPAVLALVVSHGFAFWDDFLRQGSYRNRTLGTQMAEPYGRIMVMQVTIIFGGFLVEALGTPLAALVLLIVLKIGADLRAHLKVSRQRSRAAQLAPR